MRARYDLAVKIASFDFFSWLVQAKALGATHIVFGPARPRTDKWDEDTVRRRLESILIPGSALAGLPCSEGDGGEEIARTDVSHLVRFMKEGGRIELLRSVLPAGRERYTVTLRRTERAPGRNSNEAVWRAFAREIGAVVIEDYDVQPIGLHERVALYAGARMNFFVTNGPSHLCFLCGFPAMVFDGQACANLFRRCGLPQGGQWPWTIEGQTLIWEPGEPEAIRRHFAQWQESERR